MNARFGKAVSPHRADKPLFNNPILEKLSHTNPWVPITFFSIAAAAFVVYSLVIGLPLLYVLPLFLGGLLFFTLIEYMMHRFLYHSHPKNETEATWQYKIHGIHHDYPRDPDRLAMPLPLSIAISSVFLVAYHFVMHRYAFAFFPGFILGYALYLLAHYAIHAYQPPKNVLNVIWKHHNLHHFKYHNKAFGVTSPLWDWVFGTMPRDPLAPQKENES